MVSALSVIYSGIIETQAWKTCQADTIDLNDSLCFCFHRHYQSFSALFGHEDDAEESIFFAAIVDQVFKADTVLNLDNDFEIYAVIP